MKKDELEKRKRRLRIEFKNMPLFQFLNLNPVEMFETTKSTVSVNKTVFYKKVEVGTEKREYGYFGHSSYYDKDTFNAPIDKEITITESEYNEIKEKNESLGTLNQDKAINIYSQKEDVFITYKEAFEELPKSKTLTEFNRYKRVLKESLIMIDVFLFELNDINTQLGSEKLYFSVEILEELKVCYEELLSNVDSIEDSIRKNK